MANTTAYYAYPLKAKKFYSIWTWCLCYKLLFFFNTNSGQQ
jgi:hypothetical protein